jgi:hypothetical protein
LRLQHAFYKFPFRFDVERLQAEALAIPESSWCTHPGAFKGNSHLPLISTRGEVNDRFDPPMGPTQCLTESPYIQQVLACFNTLHGRARLMRLEPGDGVPIHFDAEYYWRTHTRVHIPIVTHPGVRFYCNDENAHMAAGEAWTFDNWRMHRVVNETPTRRIHLTFDTFGSNAFWSLARPYRTPGPEQFVPFDPTAQPKLAFEIYASDPVMSPTEVDMEMMRVAADVTAAPQNDRNIVALIHRLTLAFRHDWRILWHSMGPQAMDSFTELRLRMAEECRRSVPKDVIVASNGASALIVLHSILGATTNESPQAARSRVSKEPCFDRPVFIVCAPRAGSTLLFETLARSEALWTLGGEGHGHVENIPELSPRSRDFDSNRLTEAEFTPEIATCLRKVYAKSARNARGGLYSDTVEAPASIRFLEKTPKNALRIPFFRMVFPDAKFIFLYREARANISAIMEAWLSGKFVTYRHLAGWTGKPWSMLLIPGWRELDGHELAEIATRQWQDTNDIILSDLEAIPAADWCAASYEEFVAAPAMVLRRLCAFADIPFDSALQNVVSGPLQPSRYTLTVPHPEKWRKNEAAIAAFLAETGTTVSRLKSLTEHGAAQSEVKISTWP